LENLTAANDKLETVQKGGHQRANGNGKIMYHSEGSGLTTPGVSSLFPQPEVVSRHGDNIQGWIKMLHNPPWRLEIERLDEA